MAGREITHEEIRRRAYELSQQEGAGSEEDNWLRAERELREEAEAPKHKPPARKAPADKA